MCSKTRDLVDYHIIPVELGGSKGGDNKIVVCKLCYKRMLDELKRIVNLMIACQHCGNVWPYNGKALRYATCTNCQMKTKIPEKEVE